MANEQTRRFYDECPNCHTWRDVFWPCTGCLVRGVRGDLNEAENGKQERFVEGRQDD